MAGVCSQGHADCGQKRDVDSQDKPDSGSQTERQDPPSAYADTGSLD